MTVVAAGYELPIMRGHRDASIDLLAEAYTLVADAFANVGDLAESVKWRQKAAEQTAQAREPQD